MLLDVILAPSQIEHLDQKQDHDPTLAGDLVAFLGALAMAIYLVIGRRIRAWCPVWMYVFPVVGMSVVTTVSATLLFEAATVTGLTTTSVFGFLSPKYIWYSIYLGGGAGVGGHTLINTLLKYISPVVIATALLMEPLVGCLIGSVLGVQELPGIWTWVGGVVLMVGLLLVTFAENRKSKDKIEGGGGEDLEEVESLSPDPPSETAKYNSL